jgi:hypothetical protein
MTSLKLQFWTNSKIVELSLRIDWDMIFWMLDWVQQRSVHVIVWLAPGLLFAYFIFKLPDPDIEPEYGFPHVKTEFSMSMGSESDSWTIQQSQRTVCQMFLIAYIYIMW